MPKNKKKGKKKHAQENNAQGFDTINCHHLGYCTTTLTAYKI